MTAATTLKTDAAFHLVIVFFTGTSYNDVNIILRDVIASLALVDKHLSFECENNHVRTRFPSPLGTT
jgi:hypothetical protein